MTARPATTGRNVKMRSGFHHPLQARNGLYRSTPFYSTKPILVISQDEEFALYLKRMFNIMENIRNEYLEKAKQKLNIKAFCSFDNAFHELQQKLVYCYKEDSREFVVAMNTAESMKSAFRECYKNQAEEYKISEKKAPRIRIQAGKINKTHITVENGWVVFPKIGAVKLESEYPYLETVQYPTAIYYKDKWWMQFTHYGENARAVVDQIYGKEPDRSPVPNPEYMKSYISPKRTKPVEPAGCPYDDDEKPPLFVPPPNWKELFDIKS